MTITIPGVDAQKRTELYGGDDDRYLIALQSYVDNAPEVLNKLRDVSAETLGVYAAAIGGILGFFTTIGAEELKKTAAKQEALAKEGNLAGVQKGNEAFLKQADTLVTDVKAWINRNRS